MLNQLLQKAQQLLFPYTCIFCGTSCKDLDICQLCLAHLPWSKQACLRCGAQLHKTTDLCGQCVQRPSAFNQTTALFNYAHPIDRLIIGLKFQHKLVYAKLLSHLFCEKIAANQALPDIIMPVPLHPKRLKERGFNQALELAKPIAKKLKIPLDYSSCQRIRATEAQSSIPAVKRHSNMKNAFKLAKNFKANHVAILDDVMTTTHTVNELAKTLRQAGVSKIDVWCVART